MSAPLALALGHVRNAVWQLMGNNQDDGLILGLEALEVEALLNLEDIDPEVPAVVNHPAASLIVARQLLDGVPDEVPPAAWVALQALIVKLG